MSEIFWEVVGTAEQASWSMDALVFGGLFVLGCLCAIAGICIRAYLRSYLLGMYRKAYRRGHESGATQGWELCNAGWLARRREELRNARRTSEPREDAGPSARVSKARFTSKG